MVVGALLCLASCEAAGLRTLTQAAPTPAPNAMQLQTALQNLTGTTGRPVSYKNVEAALHVAYASGGMLTPKGAVLTMMNIMHGDFGMPHRVICEADVAFT